MQQTCRKGGEVAEGGGGEKEKLPPGFRFHPTDEELVTHYLVHKIGDTNFTARAVAEVDLNKCEPWDLPGKAKMGEKEWYFFSLRDRKYPTGVRTNRATNAGYWKTTGKDKEIYDSRSSELAGMKKTLVFYKGRAPRGEKTNWVMHEYRLQPKSNFKRSTLLDEWVVCRIILKSKSTGRKYSTTGQAQRLNPYNLNVMGPRILQTMPRHHHLGLGRAADLAELFHYANGRNPASHNFNTQLNFPTIFPPAPPAAYLNLNLESQHLSPALPLFGAMTLPMAAGEGMLFSPPPLSPLPSSSSLVGGSIAGCESDYGGDGGEAVVASPRYQNLAPCMDLEEGYWPTY